MAHYLNPEWFNSWDIYIDVFCLIFPLITPTLNTLYLHPSTMCFVYYIMEKITVWVFGGVNFNLCRTIDLVKSCMGLGAFVLFYAVSPNSITFVLCSMVYNFIASTVYLDILSRISCVHLYCSSFLCHCSITFYYWLDTLWFVVKFQSS